VGVDHEIAAVGLVQGTGLDEIEVDDERAEVRQVLHATDQILVGRVVLDHHRRADARVVRDQKVGLIAPQPRRRLIARGLAALGRVLRRLPRLGGRVDEIAPHRGQMSHDLWKIGELVFALGHQMIHGERRELAMQFLQPVAPLAPPDRHLVDDALELLLQSLDSGGDALALPLGQLLVLFRIDHHTAAHGRERKSRRRMDERDALALRLLAEILKRFALALAEPLAELFRARAILLALERGGNRGQRLFGELAHRIAQLRSAAGRQLEGLGSVGLLEVVHVAPVGGLRRRRGLGFQEAAHQRVLAHARRPEHEYVIAGAAYRHTEAHCVDRAFLADRAGHGIEICCARTAEAGRIDAAPQPM